MCGHLMDTAGHKGKSKSRQPSKESFDRKVQGTSLNLIFHKDFDDGNALGQFLSHSRTNIFSTRNF